MHDGGSAGDDEYEPFSGVMAVQKEMVKNGNSIWQRECNV
jgi:hypothetical protein